MAVESEEREHEGAAGAHGEHHPLHPGPNVGNASSDKTKQRRDAKIAIAVGLVGVILAWLTLRKSSSSSSSSTTAAPRTSGTPAGYGTVANGGADISSLGGILSSGFQQLQAGQSQLSAQIGALSPSSTAGSGTGAGAGEAPAPPVAPATIGYGTIPTAQGLMDILGPAGGNVYQVGGGAPVYFGNASSLAQGSAAAQAAASGGYAYTPVAFGGQVAKTATPQAPGQF